MEITGFSVNLLLSMVAEERSLGRLRLTRGSEEGNLLEFLGARGFG
jgi:hypothetical protein